MALALGGSFYSETKSYMELMVRNYPNVLQLRLRMPIDGDLSNPRNFITKIANYAKVVDIPNSMTVLDELVPMAVDGAVRGLTGAYNWTNPGAISHNEVRALRCTTHQTRSPALSTRLSTYSSRR